MTYDEIIEQLEITKSKIKEIARNEYGGESWNDDLDALTEAADIVADYSKATAQASEMSQKYEQPAMAVRRAAGLYTCPLCGKRTQVGHTHCHWCGMLAGGKGAAATAIKVSGKVIDPSKVTKEDVIGAVDPSTGAETGAQVIRQVYPRLGIVPGLILAPGWSQIPEVGLALAAKAAKINGVYSAMALLDLDTAKAKKYTDTKSVKEESGYTSPFCYPLWPCDRVGEYILAKSAVAGAMIQYMASDNEDVPNQSPSNHLLGVGGQCLEDGTEVYLDQDQANTVNGYGVTTAINQNGYRLWGNYTGAYPASSDAKDIWFAVRRMFSWQGNNFIQTYFDEVDDPMNNVLVQSVVDSENIRCSAYAPKYWAGASIEYKSDDNPKTAILAGTMKFRQHIAPYTPAQEIVDIIDYDTDTLAAAVGGN